MPSEAAARELAEAWIGAWNSHDVDAILAHYADDVEYVSPLAANFTPDASGIIRGKDALRTYFVRTLNAYRDLQLELDVALAGVTSVAIAYGGISDRRAVEVMELGKDGRARHVTVHYAHPPREH
jgi:ketosteroid isomerase-like protein